MTVSDAAFRQAAKAVLSKSMLAAVEEHAITHIKDAGDLPVAKSAKPKKPAKPRVPKPVVPLGPSPVEQLHMLWQEVTGLRWSLNDKLRQTWRLLLVEAGTFERAQLAIRGMMLSPHHTGQNSDGQKWLDPLYVRRWLDKFADLAEAAEKPPTVDPDVESKRIDAERMAHQQHFVDTLHAIPGGWRDTVDGRLTKAEQLTIQSSQWGSNQPIGCVDHLGIMILVFHSRALDHYCVLHAACRYAERQMAKTYPNETEVNSCIRMEADLASRVAWGLLRGAHQRITNQEGQLTTPSGEPCP